MLRIAIVSPSYPPNVGGVERHVAELAPRLRSRGHHVDVLTQVRGPQPQSPPDEEHVRRFRDPIGSAAYPVSPQLWRHVLAHARDYDVVHAHDMGALPTLFSALAPSRRLVLSPHFHPVGHSGTATAAKRVGRPVLRSILGAADALFCCSQTERDELVSRYRETASRVRVAYNGVERARFRDAEPFGTDVPVILSACRLTAYKRVGVLADAVTRMQRSCKLVVLGEGPELDTLRRIAAGATGPGRIELRGLVPDEELPRWFRTATVVAALSEIEAFGLTLLEAAAAGARIVASDIPAHREVASLLGPGRVRFVPRASAAELAGLLDELISAPSSIPSEPSLPSWDDLAEAVDAAYLEVAAGSPRPLPFSLGERTGRGARWLPARRPAP